MLRIIFKPTERCNSNCKYCDVVKKNVAKDMPPELLETVFSRLGEYLCAHPGEDVSFLWHGGEPLILGPDYFRLARDLERKYFGSEKNRVHHAVQSNLTLLTTEFLQVFRELRIRGIGTSYEPLPGIRGFGAGRDWRAYNRDLLRAISLLKTSGFTYGFIYVVTREALPRPEEIFYSLTNFYGGGRLTINPVLMYGEDPYGLAVTPEEYAEFLGRVFALWWKNPERYPGVNPFAHYVNTVIKGRPTLSCSDSGDCARSFLYIGPGGETSQCGRSADWNIVSYGNIRDRGIDELLNDARRADFERRNAVLVSGECRGCRLWGLCHGGCPLDPFPEYGDIFHKTSLCAATRTFVEKYFEPITGHKYNA
jgi:uncharacterized protein